MKQSTSAQKPAWPNWRFPAAQPAATTFTFFPMTAPGQPDSCRSGNWPALPCRQRLHVPGRKSKVGFPRIDVTEDEAFILKDSQRLIEQYHDPGRHAMLRMVLAPCSPFSVTPDLMRESAKMARAYGVRLHTHLAETWKKKTFCLETFGKRPVEYVESLGWTGDDVWHAHCVHMSEHEIEPFRPYRHRRIAHCPNSNMRLASGIAPVPEMAGAKGARGSGRRWFSF
jgi:8-oxoguanine deaminase